MNDEKNEGKKEREHFVGDDGVDWDQHALLMIKELEEGIKKGERLSPLRVPDLLHEQCPFDYFCFLLRPGSRVLDLGCNIGRFSTIFLAHGWNYVGLDASPTAVRFLSRTLASLKDEEIDDDVTATYLKGYREGKVSASVVLGRAEHLDDYFEPESFDLVFTNTVLQHMHNSTKVNVLSRVHDVLRSHGYLVIQEVIDETNVRAFSRWGWIEFVTGLGFTYLRTTEEGDPRNGFVFMKKKEKKKKKEATDG